jgi:Flp pilus assembly protein TadD
LEVDAQNFAMWQNLAALYAQKGDTAQAEACMQKSKTLQAAQNKK